MFLSQRKDKPICTWSARASSNQVIETVSRKEKMETKLSRGILDRTLTRAIEKPRRWS